jgi:hypothetical protein
MGKGRQPLFVPVRRTPGGSLTPQTARLPEGARTGVAFTSATALAAACRPGQPWIRLSESALRNLLSPIGVLRIQVDPVLIAADVTRPTDHRNVSPPAPAPAPVGV